jgi:carbon storage regulator
MFVLSRRVDQSVQLSDSIVVRILSIKGRQVRLGLIAPPEIRILRSELADETAADGLSAPPARRRKRGDLPER